jgi:hypothetical protein
MGTFVQVLDQEMPVFEGHLAAPGEWVVDGSTVRWVVAETTEPEPAPEEEQGDEPQEEDEPEGDEAEAPKAKAPKATAKAKK